MSINMSSYLNCGALIGSLPSIRRLFELIRRILPDGAADLPDASKPHTQKEFPQACLCASACVRACVRHGLNEFPQTYTDDVRWNVRWNVRWYVRWNVPQTYTDDNATICLAVNDQVRMRTHRTDGTARHGMT